ncbi:MAG: zeta toxin family protein [Lachnospiraceae bacterium]|nr:zeta toxin family protein [Lachnospiraceae bacterium]
MTYINADDIKRTIHCSDLEAAKKAEELRKNALQSGLSFTFETVLSTERNLNLLKDAREKGYFIRCIYVLTSDPDINIIRVEAREANGGHGVPEEKIVKRYQRCLALLPELEKICDILHIYDNTYEPFRIYKKRKEEYFIWENDFWNKDQIEKLVGLDS